MMMPSTENDALTKDDLRVLRRLAVAKRDELRRQSDTTADVLWAYDVLLAKLDRATGVIPPARPRCNPLGGVHAEWCPDHEETP